MKQTILGSSGIRVSALGLGCMGMSEFYGERDDAESMATLEHALARGITFFDTADIYGSGHNEELVGRFARGKRDRLVIATKFAIVRPSATSYARRIDNSPACVRSACEASLRRLGIDVIDLFYAHRLDANARIEDTVGALADLRRQGKIRAIGLCEVKPETLRRAHAVHPIAAVQTEYSVWTRDPEDGVLQACRALGVAFVPYSPLGRGILTGAITDTNALAASDFRRANPRFQGDNFQRNLAIVAEFKALAQAKGCTAAQLAIAWLLAQGDDIVPIPGTRRRKYLDDNLGALDVTLTRDDLARIARIAPRERITGERYTAEGMKGVNV
jgi:aryl-alcohol dehydrogenase-like predicted oxidoreductase